MFSRRFAEFLLVPALVFAELAVAGAADAQTADYMPPGVSIGDRIASFRADAERLRTSVDQDEAAVSTIEQQRPGLVTDYSGSVSAIGDKLTAGTTPGNPDLVSHWQMAQTDLGKLDGTIGSLSAASGHLSEAAALATYLETSVHAAVGLPGATDSQHQELLGLQQLAADSASSLKQLVGQISREIEGQLIALGDERRNLLVLRHAIEIGAPLGNSLANGTSSRLAALRAPGPYLKQMAALPPQSSPPAVQPQQTTPTQVAMAPPPAAPTPVAPAPEPPPVVTPKPVAEPAPMPAPVALPPAPMPTPAAPPPAGPASMTPAPMTPAPASPTPVAVAPVSAAPVPQAPVTLAPANPPSESPPPSPPSVTATAAPPPIVATEPAATPVTPPPQVAMLPPPPPPSKPLVAQPAVPDAVERPLPTTAPLFVVASGQTIDQFESKLYESVTKVLDRKPDATIQIFAMKAPDDTAGSAATQRQARAIADALDAFGIASDHISISSGSGAGSKAPEVRIYAP